MQNGQNRCLIMKICPCSSLQKNLYSVIRADRCFSRRNLNWNSEECLPYRAAALLYRGNPKWTSIFLQQITCAEMKESSATSLVEISTRKTQSSSEFGHELSESRSNETNRKDGYGQQTCWMQSRRSTIILLSEYVQHFDRRIGTQKFLFRSRPTHAWEK